MPGQFDAQLFLRCTPLSAELAGCTSLLGVSSYGGGVLLRVKGSFLESLLFCVQALG